MRISNDFNREVLKFMKISSDFHREVLKLMKKAIKSIGFMTIRKKTIIKMLGFLIHGQLEACILRGSISEIELPLSYDAHSRGARAPPSN